MRQKLTIIISRLVIFGSFFISIILAHDKTGREKFQQLGTELPTPNTYRTAAGYPGHEYYQQQADYKMQIKLDDESQRIDGKESITYHNNSPDVLHYLWLQLDQNVRAPEAERYTAEPQEIDQKMEFLSVERMHRKFEGGFKIESVRDAGGNPLPYIINKTMMRIDLPAPLASGSKISFSIKWWYNINDHINVGGRSGYEYFDEDDNYLYTIAQFYPRMTVYNDVYGWQNKQFLGSGEFTLSFGDFEVQITVPSDHVVAATGVLQNPKEVLTRKQRSRLKEAESASRPVIIITSDDALENEKSRAAKTKTWKFKAENVRDFAFASSRKFIWDAMGVSFGNRTVLAMSFYPKEGNPLWEQYSTKVVAHTINTYSKYTFEYPYPVAISVHTKWMGMEYPMICFNGGRPEPDSTYSERTKYGMIGVITHEVGHNYFPMIVNSDERQWTWLDEGFNTFVQYLTEQEWDHDYPSRRGPAPKIVNYMKGDKSEMVPIMTNSESILQFGNNAYGKTATALNILRETIMGRELFDFAFQEYAQTWMFKHPTPADFFRIMENASGMDLDWFWRGWFFSTEHVDIAIDAVNLYHIDTKDPNIENPINKKKQEKEQENISIIRNRELLPATQVELDSTLLDFYNRYDPFEITVENLEEYDSSLSDLDEDELQLLADSSHYYEIKLSNPGGLVMPIILEFELVDGTKQIEYVPAEIWRYDAQQIWRVFITAVAVKQIVLDPFLQTADVNRINNYWPTRIEPSRFKLYKDDDDSGDNPMRKVKQTEMEEQADTED